MALSTGSSKLSLGLKALKLQWEEAKTHWQDPVSQAFEKDHLQPLEDHVVATLRAIERLAAAVTRARHECS